MQLPLYIHYIIFFFFNDTATTEIYTLSLHDALPICPGRGGRGAAAVDPPRGDRANVEGPGGGSTAADRKSTRLNSSHSQISYAVFCLKKKKKKKKIYIVIRMQVLCILATKSYLYAVS